MPRVPPALALTALLVVAGCTGPVATNPTAEPTTQTTEPTTQTTESAERTTELTDHAHFRSYTVTAEATTIADVAAEIARSPAELERREAGIVRDAAANGTASRVRMGAEVRLDPAGEPVVVNGTYARVNATVAWSENVTAHYVTADGPLGTRYNESELVPYRERAVAFEDLPPADRRAVEATIHVADHPFRNLHGIGYWHHFENGTAPERSVLADGETHVVRYNDTLWKIRLNPNRTSEQVRYRVDFELHTIAETESAWQSYVRETRVRNLSALPVSPEARGVVRQSIENGRVHWEGTTETEPPKFRELYDLGGAFYVTRNGTLYRITVRKVME